MDSYSRFKSHSYILLSSHPSMKLNLSVDNCCHLKVKRLPVLQVYVVAEGICRLYRLINLFKPFLDRLQTKRAEREERTHALQFQSETCI